MIFASATAGAASMAGQACTTKVPGPTKTNTVVSATPQWQGNGPFCLAVQESSHSGRESAHHSGNQGNCHHHHHDQDDYDLRLPRNREPGQNPKMTPHDCKVAWCAYEMKLEHMANQYNWGEAEKLNKPVETLQDKALTFYSNLLDNVHENYGLVRRSSMPSLGQRTHHRLFAISSR